MAQFHTTYIGAIVSAPDGRILCQLRDDFPWITCPGTWCCCPGGHLEPGELPEEAVLRELREEFDIAVSRLTPLATHIEGGGEYQGIYHSFTADLTTAMAEVKCYEGVRAEFFDPQTALDLPQHPMSRLFLQTYLERLRSAGAR